MATNKETAYVLHRYDWSESSLILDVFTRESGRVALAAKGAKRPYSQLRSVLLPFQRLLVSYGSKRTENAEIATLRSAEWAGGEAMLSGEALFGGFYLNELLMKLLARQDAHPLLFDAYAQTLPALLHKDELQKEAALRAFELMLLRQTGVLPLLSVVTSTQVRVMREGHYALHAEKGLMCTSKENTSITGACFEQIETAFLARSLERLQAACATHLVALKNQLRIVVQHHLGYQELKTRQVLTALRQVGAMC
jgi:DNA repair protein RecO (recombination protein O)